MFKRLTLTALVLGVSLVLFSQVSADTLPEKYVKKVIIDAKWGNGPGEFGRIWNSDMQFWETPTCFGTDYEKKLYVCDFFNGRILVFDERGNYRQSINYTQQRKLKFVPKQMVIDDKENIYILGVIVRPVKVNGEEINTTIFEIRKYNQQGNLLHTYGINNLGNSSREKFKGADINNYLSGLPPHYKLEIRDGKIMVGDMIVGATDKSLQSIKREPQIYNFKFNLRKREEVKVTIDGKSITAKVLKDVYSANYCGIDRMKNIYITERKEGKKGEDTLFVLKYDLSGRLKGYLKYSNEYGHVMDKKVDNDGNIYLLVCSDEGLKILKYEKQ